jgi:hypothetical protein
MFNKPTRFNSLMTREGRRREGSILLSVQDEDLLRLMEAYFLNERVGCYVSFNIIWLLVLSQVVKSVG